MNRNFIRAFALVVLAIGSASAASAQNVGLGGWVGFCIDPTATNPVTYSPNYGDNGVFDSLFGSMVGVQGTVGFSKKCFPPNGFTANVAGRVEFNTGPVGSVQSDNDKNVALTMGGTIFEDPSPGGFVETGTGTGGNWGDAKVFQADVTNGTAGTLTGTLFGAAAIDTTFIGASARYVDAESTVGNTRVQLRIDVFADTARLQWTLTNRSANNAVIGLWFGQWVRPISNDTLQPLPMEFVNVPGQKPLITSRRFVRNPNLSANNPHEFPMPDYVNFMPTQSTGWAGLQVVTSSSTDPNGPVADQTPCDVMDVGIATFLLGSTTANDGAMPDILGEDIDTVQTGEQAYLQKWNPVQVGNAAQAFAQKTRQIVAYYRTTWGDPLYGKNFQIVADTPKVISTPTGNPYAFAKTDYTLRVYVDNSPGYAINGQFVPLNDVNITLNLPQGLSALNNPTQQVLSQTINVVDPRKMNFVDFHFQALPDTFGQLNYSITVNAASVPNGVKTLTGAINIGSQARLEILAAANLIGSPWVYTSTDWASILAADPNDPADVGLVPDIDYQAFGWDATTQQYILQTGPQRGHGTWILSNKNVGFKKLNGGPQTPTDLGSSYPYATGGAPLIVMKPGWNLVANPYNYAIPIGQLVGISGEDPSQSLTYADMVNQNIISGSFSFWDQLTQSYEVVSNSTDLLEPNTGYWVFVLSAQDVTISFPPVFLPFLPAGNGVSIAQPWKLNLIAKNMRYTDHTNWLGYVDPHSPKTATIYKPPASPARDAISAYFKAGNAVKPLRLAQQLVTQGRKQSWTFDVFTKSAGSASVSWPNIASVPAGYSVTMTDLTAGATIDLRKQNRFNYTSRSNGTREFKITVQAPYQPLLGKVTVRPGATRNDPSTIAYTLTDNATTTIKVLQNGRLIANVVTDKGDGPGTSSVQWNGKNYLGHGVKPGVYQAQVSVTDGQGDNEQKLVSFTVH